MGQIGDNFRRIKHDCGNSWYFRIWILFWLVCFGLAIAVLFIMSSRVPTQAYSKAYVQTTVSNNAALNFPKFTVTASDVIAVACTAGITTTACNEAGTRCFYLVAADQATPAKNSFNCTFNTIAPEVTVDITTTPGVEVTGVNAGAPLAIVGLRESLVQLKESKFLQGNTSSTLYERVLSYSSAQAAAGIYHVTFKFATFEVRQDEVIQSLIYDGWSSAAQIGGFIYFTYTIHQIIMLLVGILFTNNSKFLKQEPVAHNRQTDREENP